MITVVEAAWAAGFLDGEGYIGIHRKHTRNRYRKDPALYYGKEKPFVQTPSHYQLTLQVTQRNRVPLDKLVALFGGNIRQRKATDRGTVYWEWVVQSTVAWRCLAQVAPYLVGKQHVGSVALEFAAWYAGSRNEKGFGRSMTDARRAQAEEYFLEVQRTNRLYRDVPEQSVRKQILGVVSIAASGT